MKNGYKIFIDNEVVQCKCMKKEIKFSCINCLHIDNCNIQNTVCMAMAREWPLSLLMKDLNHNCYELNYDRKKL